MTTVWPPSRDRLAQQVEHLGGDVGVQRAGRLVGERDGGLGDQRPRDRDALALAAGELERPVAQPRAEPDALEDLLHARRAPARRPASRSGSSTFWATVSVGIRLKL